jgi:tetratricopeptide (TPR) repeat protein
MLPQTDDALAPPLETDPASLQGTEPGQGIPASSNTSTKFNVPEYFHHLTKDIPDTEAVTIPEGIENHFLPSTKSIYTARAKQTQTFDHLLPTKGRDTALAEGIPTPQAAEHHPPGTNFSKITPSSQLKKTKPPERQAASPPEKIDTEKQTAERLSKQKKSRAVSAVATLSADLEDAIEKNDAPRINTLLAILARIQDKNSAYYLKLKAFKEIRDENYEAARKLLNKVLAKDKTDFEAGINMAIIEIKEQSFASAKKRLVRLRALYPSQGAIDDLLDML